ncbi:MAG: hypothetical protein ACTSWQ_06685 [Candidatus Thorarchaeota archaeon]
MTGYNLPPGCEVHHLPGNRPEDVAWDHYWEQTYRPDEVYKEFFGKNDVPEDFDLYNLYTQDKDFREAIDKDFESWNDEPEDPDIQRKADEADAWCQDNKDMHQELQADKEQEMDE